MLIRFTNLITILAISTAASIFPSVAIADTKSPYYELRPLETWTEVFDRGLFHNSRYSFENVTILRQIDTILGPRSFPEGNYPENEINRDARLINILHRDMLEQQVSSDPIIRTPDLANPFNDSLRSKPTYNRLARPVVGTEFVYERLPLR